MRIPPSLPNVFRRRWSAALLWVCAVAPLFAADADERARSRPPPPTPMVEALPELTVQDRRPGWLPVAGDYGLNFLGTRVDRPLQIPPLDRIYPEVRPHLAEFGLQPGERIVGIGGKPVIGMRKRELIALIFEGQIGETVTLMVQAAGPKDGPLREVVVTRRLCPFGPDRN